MPCAKKRTVFIDVFFASPNRSSSGSRLALPTTPDPTWQTQLAALVMHCELSRCAGQTCCKCHCRTAQGMLSTESAAGQ